MNDLHGILFAYRSNSNLGELTRPRNTCSLPFGGRYRLVDFMLSNYINAGITDVGIIVHESYQSLLDHLGSGKDWELSRKHGGLRILPPFGYAERGGEYKGNMDALAGVADYLPAVSGFLIQKELEVIGGALANPKRPLVAILGGSKVSSKIGVINNLLEIADTIIIGGGMAYTFSAAQGGQVGDSLLEADWEAYSLEMLEKAKAKGVKLLLPVDTVIADAFSPDANSKVVTVSYTHLRAHET